MPASVELGQPSVDSLQETQTRVPLPREACLQLVNLLAHFGTVQWRGEQVLIDLSFPNLKKPVEITLNLNEPHLTIKHPHQERVHKLDEPYKVYRFKNLKDTRFSFAYPTFRNCLVFAGAEKIIILEDWGGVQELPANLTKLPRDSSFLPPDWETSLRPTQIIHIAA